MKKICMVLVALTMALTASAQFEEGKFYTNASLDGLGMGYNGASGFKFGVSAQAGYCIVDNWMVLAKAGFSTQTEESSANTVLSLGVGARYYIIQNGLYLGLNAQYKHAHHYNDFVPEVEIGYAFFLNKHVTIEPALYYDQSFKDHGDYSTVGARVGLGFYF